MGKKRNTSVKKIAEMLIANNPSGFTIDFEANKSIVNEIMDFPSKIVRNEVAGQITCLKKRDPQSVGNFNPYYKGKRWEAWR